MQSNEKEKMSQKLFNQPYCLTNPFLGHELVVFSGNCYYRDWCELFAGRRFKMGGASWNKKRRVNITFQISILIILQIES